MASNVIPFPVHAAKPRVDIAAAREHIAHLRAVIATTDNTLTIALGRHMLDWYEQQRLFEHQNDNVIPLRRA